jgi:hypothetical protein
MTSVYGCHTDHDHAGPLNACRLPRRDRHRRPKAHACRSAGRWGYRRGRTCTWRISLSPPFEGAERNPNVRAWPDVGRPPRSASLIRPSRKRPGEPHLHTAPVESQDGRCRHFLRDGPWRRFEQSQGRARRVVILPGADRGAPWRWSQPDGVLRAAWAAQGHVQLLQVEARRRHRSRPQRGR